MNFNTKMFSALFVIKEVKVWKFILSVVKRVGTDVTIKSIDVDNIYDVSATLAKCWKYAYKGLVNDKYLSSVKNTHWVEFLEKSINDNTI